MEIYFETTKQPRISLQPGKRSVWKRWFCLHDDEIVQGFRKMIAEDVGAW